MPGQKTMTPKRAAELQELYARQRREHRERLGLAHEVGDRTTAA